MGSKHVFWQALVLAVLIFVIGFIFGFFLETFRASQVEFNLANAEINLLDEQLRIKGISDLNTSCDSSIAGMFDFADNIYSDASKLEKYGASSQLSKEFLLLHKRYDLLRSFLWFEAIGLKDRCDGDFHTLVYLYDYSSEDIDKKSKQIYFSRVLTDLKSKYPDEILLIPIAANMNLSSVDLAVSGYEIEEFPVIIVDEKEVISDILTFEEIENVIFENNN